MSFNSLPSDLSPLSEREAIQDTLYRGVTGLDTADEIPFNSAFTNNAIWDINGIILNGLGAIQTGCYNNIAKLNTTHFITNTRIKINANGSTASMTAFALAQHYRQEQGLVLGAANLLTGVVYSLSLTKCDDGLWKATRFRMRTVWSEGDRTIALGK